MNTPILPPSPLWRVELFGQLRAVHREQTVTRFRRHKDGVLLAYLAFTHSGGTCRERSHSREELIELLWPGCDPDAGRDRLSTTLTSLRRQLEPAGIAAGTVFITDRATVGLRASAVSTDVAEFEAVLESARCGRNHREQVHWFLEAVELYRGELLPGYFEVNDA